MAGSGQRTPRTYRDDELAPFLDTFAVLFEPEALERAPLGRSLGRYAGLVGLSLGEALHAITGKDRQALLAGETLDFPMNFESVDLADLHVICGAIDNHADAIVSSDRVTLGYDPIGSLRVRSPRSVAVELGLIDQALSAARVGP